MEAGAGVLEYLRGRRSGAPSQSGQLLLMRVRQPGGPGVGAACPHRIQRCRRRQADGETVGTGTGESGI